LPAQLGEGGHVAGRVGEAQLIEVDADSAQLAHRLAHNRRRRQSVSQHGGTNELRESDAGGGFLIEQRALV
jgi:hypothetical protein